MRIVLPRNLCKIDVNYGPVFFLAGPVRGGDNWQTKCCEEIRRNLPNFYAFIPCRHEEVSSLTKFQVPGVKDAFVRQLNWERHYLEIAGETENRGCIIFWLPAESKVNPRTGGEPYAMDTRGELGEWRGRMIYDPDLRVVIGAEPNFPGLSQIQRNFNQALDMEFPIYPTLEETVQAAIKKAV